MQKQLKIVSNVSWSSKLSVTGSLRKSGTVRSKKRESKSRLTLSIMPSFAGSKRRKQKLPE